MSDERIMTQAEAEAGTSTEKLATTPERQRQAISALPGGIESTATTTDATLTVLDAIDNLTDNSTHIVNIYVTAEEDGVEGGVWDMIIRITKRSGTVTLGVLIKPYTDNDASASRLNASAVTVVINSGNADIQIIGAAAHTYKWNGLYKIISVSTLP